MSSYSGPPLGPLTTIFTPPADCSITPDIWQPCGVTTIYGSTETRCYWSQPYNCYPDSSRIEYGGLWGLTSTLLASVYLYSPGVLPSGYVKENGLVDGTGADTASGCLSGWTSDHYCTSAASGQWLDSSGSTRSGNFKAVLPQIAVTWQSSDLSLFAPASAPVLPTESLESYESSVAARTRTINNAQSTTPPSRTPPTAATQSSTSTSSPASGGGAGGLSTGAKAGIGVGVAVGVLLLLAFALLMWRRKKKPNEEQSRGGYNGPPYRDTAELPNSQMRPKELPAEHELRQVPGPSRNAPPIPVASKPRFHAELQ